VLGLALARGGIALMAARGRLPTRPACATSASSGRTRRSLGFPVAAFDVAISVIEPALMNRAAASALAGVAVSVGGVAGSEAQVLGVVDRLV
jgi:hypothetical protein